MFARSFTSNLIALSLSVAGWAMATVPAHSQEVLDLTMVSEVKSVQPGAPFHVALSLQHKEGYHTYWKFPGIVGVPTSMDWELPPGWQASEILWPAPEQVHMFKIRAQGYHGNLLLPVQITPPKDLAVGSEVTLKGKSSWMCCGRDCNPGFTDLTLKLPVTAAVPAADLRWQKPIAAALKEVPNPLQGWKVSAVRSAGDVTLKLVPEISGAVPEVKEVLFFTDDGLINADKDQKLERGADGSLTLRLEVSQYADQPLATSLNGVLQSPQSWGGDGAESVSISVPITVKDD